MSMINFSIIIATCNRHADLKICLESLLAQQAHGDFSIEIIVADNNSSDATKEVVHSFMTKFPRQNIRYLFEGRQGKCFALNAAIAQVKGDIVVFIDDDVILSSNWFQTLLDFVQKNQFDAACGRILPRYPADAPAWVKENSELLSGPIVSYDYGPDVKVYNQREMHPLVGANLIVRRQLFEEVGVFNTQFGPGAGTYGDDTEICLRWEKKNKKLFYAGTVQVWHPVVKERMTLGYIARWNKACGRYAVVLGAGQVPAGIVRYGGVPRYLIRRILTRALKLSMSFLNKKEFLTHWVFLFREIGTAQAYRQFRSNLVKGK